MPEVLVHGQKWLVVPKIKGDTIEVRVLHLMVSITREPDGVQAHPFSIHTPCDCGTRCQDYNRFAEHCEFLEGQTCHCYAPLGDAGLMTREEFERWCA